MTTRVRISCINKHEHYNPHERIINIGGVNPDGNRRKMAQQKAIEAIKKGEYAFYVKVGNYETNVIISTHNGHEYIKTLPDTTGKDNLWNLPECPV
jgi:aspartate/methionine/tyrosine aminotransferase